MRRILRKIAAGQVSEDDLGTRRPWPTPPSLASWWTRVPTSEQRPWNGRRATNRARDIEGTYSYTLRRTPREQCISLASCPRLHVLLLCGTGRVACLWPCVWGVCLCAWA